MKAEIITIGDEILIGQIVDTNSAWMAEQLNLAGIDVHQITSVGDRHEHILETLKEAESRVDAVLITGGLGPTRDDITKKALCEYFGTTLLFHEPTYERLLARFTKAGIPVNRLNHDQALVPASCTVIPNLKGTAPGMWFEVNDTIFISMPGVPFEMTDMMAKEILPRLKATGKTIQILHKTILTHGVAESILAERLHDWENDLPSSARLAYLPSPMGVRLRITITGEDTHPMADQMKTAVDKLIPLIPDCFYGFDEETLSGVIGNLLAEKNWTLAVAESCTGGNIAHLITLTPGSSLWFTGSVTAYSNQVKTELLGVSPDTLEQFGAVSSQTSTEMAIGIKKIMKCDFAVATTGIAGPGGGSPEKPVGTIWISVAGPTKFICEKFVFMGDRERFIQRASQTAFHILKKLIVQETK